MRDKFMRKRSRNTDLQKSRADKRRGFTMVELLVAIVVLAIGVLGLAGTSALVLRQMTAGNSHNTASQVAASRFENLAGRVCPTTPTSGSATFRGISETWSITPSDNRTLIATVTVTIPRRAGAQTFTSVISCF